MSSSVAEPVEDLEALRLGDVLQVDATEAGEKRFHRFDDLVGIVGAEADRHGVDAAEVLEEHRLALHHRQAGEGSDVAEAEDAAAVGDDRDAVALAGLLVDRVGVLGDCPARLCDAGRVPDGEVLETAHRALRHHLHLAPIEGVEAERLHCRALGALLRLRRLHDFHLPTVVTPTPEANGSESRLRNHAAWLRTGGVTGCGGRLRARRRRS